MGRKPLLAGFISLVMVFQILVAPGFCKSEPAFSETNLPLLSGFDTDDGLSHNTVYTALQDRTGFLWLGTEEGLNRYDGYEFKTYRHDPLNANSLSHDDSLFLLEDRQGFLWAATWGGGLNRFDPKTETFVYYRADPAR